MWERDSECVRDKERQRQRQTDRERQRERQRETKRGISEWVSVWGTKGDIREIDNSKELECSYNEKVRR